MSLKLRWVGEDERDRVAETRMLCYAAARRQLADYIDWLRKDARGKPGDWLLAERDGEAIGTATSLGLTMWVRGAALPCQGVANVGTIKTQRRKKGAGVASAIMQETLRAGRERGFVLSALMPFRGSFYEHFGYGFVERRMDWTIPMSVLPHGDFEHFRFFRPDDFDELVRFKQKLTERGQCDIERSAGMWRRVIEMAEAGHVVVQRQGEGPIRSAIYFEQRHDKHLDTLRVEEALYEDTGGLKGVLGFLASLRDQYSLAAITLPADVRLDWLLKESQMTHRDNRNHPTAEARPCTRMQVRVLDHVKLIEAMKLPPERAGKVVVAIAETEGNVSKLAIELKDGKATAAATQASADVEMSDRVWAAVALGDLPATRAAELGLVSVTKPAGLAVLDVLAAGPVPFCREYF